MSNTSDTPTQRNSGRANGTGRRTAARDPWGRSNRWWAQASEEALSGLLLNPKWILEVATTPDTPLRTHRITFTYSQLAGALNRMLFAEPHGVTNANWFHFATWGTYTLGPNIRDDAAPQRLDSLPSAVRKRILPTIIHSRAAGGHLVGRALSWGQNLIFMSSARTFIQFRLEAQRLVKPGSRFGTTDSQKKALLDQLNQGATRWLDEGHLTLIDKAFDCYALIRRNAAAKAVQGEREGRDALLQKLCLFSTVLLTVVEQDLVSSALRTLTDSVPVRLLTEIDGRLSSVIAGRRNVPREVVAVDLLGQLSRSATWMNEAWARFMTKEMLVMVLPAETLRLGKDVPPRDFAGPMYPPALDDLTVDDTIGQAVEAEFPEKDRERAMEYLVDLDALVRSLSRTGPDGHGSAARDWRRFDDRLNWAICLFRSRQQDATVLWLPYSREDEHRLIEGLLPHSHSFDGVIPPLDANAIGAFLGVEGKAVTEVKQT